MLSGSGVRNPSRAGWWSVATALAALGAAAAASDPAPGPEAGAAFQDAFRDYYGAVANFGVEDLRFELSETVEDVLTRGSHLTRASMDYRVRQLEATLFDRLRTRLCPEPRPALGDLSALTRVAAVSASDAARREGVELDGEALGMISGIVVRLVQAASVEALCPNGE